MSVIYCTLFFLRRSVSGTPIVPRTLSIKWEKIFLYTVFGWREIVKREGLKREKEEKSSISEWKETRERERELSRTLFPIFSMKRRKELEMLMCLEIPLLSFSLYNAMGEERFGRLVIPCHSIWCFLKKKSLFF